MSGELAGFGITDEKLLRSPIVKRRKKKLAPKVVAYAKSIAPEDTGDFKDSIHADKNADRVGSNDPKANMLEWGTVDTPEFATFARTAKHFGGRAARAGK